MKNIHLLPTDKPSRLRYNLSNVLVLTKEFYRDYGTHLNQNIYIISDEEIKPSDYYLWKGKEVIKANDIEISFHPTVIIDCKKIILTTDQDLIKDGVQVIDDEFLEWFVNNPSCEEVEVYKDIRLELEQNFHFYEIIILKEEAKQRAENYMSLKGALEPKDVVLGYKTSLDAQMLDKIEPKQETTLEEVAERLYPRLINDPYNPMEDDNKEDRDTWLKGAKWMQERSYSEEEVLEIVSNCDGSISQAKKWFEQFKNKQNCLQIK